MFAPTPTIRVGGALVNAGVFILRGGCLRSRSKYVQWVTGNTTAEKLPVRPATWGLRAEQSDLTREAHAMAPAFAPSPGRAITPAQGGLPHVDGSRPRTTHAVPARALRTRERGWKANATLSTGLMHVSDAGRVGHALPTTPGLSKHHDLDGLRAGCNSPTILRPLLTSVTDWQSDDRALYGSAHQTWASGYESEVDFSPAKRQHTAKSYGAGAKSQWGPAESDTRLSWPQRANNATAPTPAPVSAGQLSVALLGEDDWDGCVLHQEFQERVASARRRTVNPHARYEPAEGGKPGEAGVCVCVCVRVCVRACVRAWLCLLICVSVSPSDLPP